MKTHARSTKLVAAVAALLLVGAAVAAVTQRVSPAVTRVPVCVKGNGQLRVVTGNNAACGPSEQQMDWVVGGEVTDIRLGQGLVGGRDDGIVSLALDPSVIETCNNCGGGQVFAGFNDGPGPIPTGLSPAQIAELALPAGSYAIFAKMTLANEKDEEGTVAADRVFCRLQAEGDFDNAELVISDVNETLVFHPHAEAAGMNLQVVHHFADPGSVTLSCHEADSHPDLSYRDLKIIAVRASGVSNVFLGGD